MKGPVFLIFAISINWWVILNDLLSQIRYLCFGLLKHSLCFYCKLVSNLWFSSCPDKFLSPFQQKPYIPWLAPSCCLLMMALWSRCTASCVSQFGPVCQHHSSIVLDMRKRRRNPIMVCSVYGLWAETFLVSCILEEHTSFIFENGVIRLGHVNRGGWFGYGGEDSRQPRGRRFIDPQCMYVLFHSF